MLVEDTTAPRKQRHTARRILARLIEEHGAKELSYSTVRDYVRVPRAQIDVEAGRRVEVFVPQQHAPGAEADVDFGELWVVLNRVKTKCHMFVYRLSHSGKAVPRVYLTQARRPSWRDISRRSPFWVASRPSTFVTATSPARSPQWYSGKAGNASRTTDGYCFARTTVSTRSTASSAWRGS